MSNLTKALVLATCVAVQSGSAAGENSAEDVLAFCKGISDLANQIMINRQDSIPMAEMMEIMNKRDSLKKITQAMVVEAYSTSVYSTKEYREKAISEFRDKWYLACIQHYGEALK